MAAQYSHQLSLESSGENTEQSTPRVYETLEMITVGSIAQTLNQVRSLPLYRQVKNSMSAHNFLQHQMAINQPHFRRT